MASDGSNKAKIAKRVIEVLEFFDEDHPQATVMDIVRRFDRPQSSTSELLSSLVEIGMLYKDPQSRAYSPTPRAAMLGCAAQPGVVRDGRLTGLIDRLTVRTGLGVGVFGMVGLAVQIYSWRTGLRAIRSSDPYAMAGGQKDHLHDSAVGRLLLSTVVQPRRDSVLRRLNAEAPSDRKFCVSEVAAKLHECQAARSASGPVGFGTSARITSVLLPGQPNHQPLAIGLVYNQTEQVDAAVLVQTLHDAVARCFDAPQSGATEVQPLFGPAPATAIGWQPTRAVTPASVAGPLTLSRSALVPERSYQS